MALSDDDKQWIKGAIVEGINESYEVLFAPRFDAIDSKLDSIERKLATLEWDKCNIKNGDILTVRTGGNYD